MNRVLTRFIITTLAIIAVGTIVTLISLSVRASHAHQEGHPHQEQQKIVVTSPKAMDKIITQQYVCQMRSQQHVKVCALANGFLEKISVKEGQAVKEGQVLFKIMPVLYKNTFDAEKAEADIAQQKYNNTERLFNDKIVSERELLLYKAELAKAKAKANRAEAEFNFTTVKARFDGIVDGLHECQEGTLIKEGEVLTTLSDNRVMWVYFNVPEARYQEYMATPAKEKEEQRIELVLASGSKFQRRNSTSKELEPVPGKIGAIMAKFNNETGNISFRADFENRDGLLRHGMTGTVLIHRTVNAIVIPQRATFEILDKQYVYVVDKNNAVKQREIFVQELEDNFVVKKGLSVDDKIVYEGVRQVRDGDKIEYELRPLEQIFANQKYHAE